MKVEGSPTARQQIGAFAAWWNENRKEARVRVEDALEAAIEAMAEHPGLGPPYRQDPKYRTWRLKGTPYVLFYRVDDAGVDGPWSRGAPCAVWGPVFPEAEMAT